MKSIQITVQITVTVPEEDVNAHKKSLFPITDHIIGDGFLTAGYGDFTIKQVPNYEGDLSEV